MFEINEKINGFTMIRRRSLEEISAELYEFEHDGCGARLVYLDRDDANKAFAIAFPTPPTDDTGVFHIIEHSVLCGSKKYPLKDPFAELLKGSLNTFLNAMTYEDRTVYPVSSRCEKDFQNLMDVYLDAVLAPAMLENPSVFLQEGRHFEYDKETDTLTVNGVVYNEMKGAYSSPDEIGAMELSRAMYPDTYLGKDSGGDPSAIPSLTYEKFIETYKKHYHPTLSRIILDGKMDVRAALSIINDHLSRFGRCGEYPLFPKSKAIIAEPRRVSFEIPESEEEAGHGRFLFGYAASDYSDKATHLAATMLCDLLTGTNASPLKKALLDKNIAKDAVMYVSKSVENTLILEVRDTDEEKFAEVEKTINEVVSDLVANGIDKKRLTSILDHLDFKQREQDYGTTPVGITNALAAFGGWMYGSVPEDMLLLSDTLAFLREQVNCGYFERKLSELMQNNPHRASVIMVPDKTLAQRSEEENEKLLADIRATLTESDLEKIAEENARLEAWQQTDDEAATSTLPKLSLSDITDNSDKVVTEEYTVKGAKILRQSMKTNGIVYIFLLFDAKDLSADELLPLSIMSSTLTNLATQNRDPLTLQSDIKSTFGSFVASGSVFEREGKPKTFLRFFASALETKKNDALDIILDILLNTSFDDEREIMNTIIQAKSQLEDAIVSSGESVAISRVEAGVNEASVVSEYLAGYEAYKILRDACTDESKAAELIKKIKSLYKKLITRERLTISLAGEYDGEFVEKIIDSLPEEKGEIVPTKFGACTDDKEFFVVPSRVAYAAMAGRTEITEKNLALLRVARSILSYEYLWNTIRVKNGAYGAGFIPRRDGVVTFYSYRDPSPASSVKIFKESANYLRETASGDFDLTKFIIGAIGEYDILTTPKTRAILNSRDYVCGIPSDFEDKVRREMLGMTASDLLACADILDSLAENARVATVGGAEHLKAFDEAMTVIEI